MIAFLRQTAYHGHADGALNNPTICKNERLISLPMEMEGRINSTLGQTFCQPTLLGINRQR